MVYRIGQKVTGTVTGIQPYGVFVALDESVQGLIHISECGHGFVKALDEQFAVGQQLDVLVLDVDEYTHKISLSLRALHKAQDLLPQRAKKHYWTNRRIQTGFAPIAERLPGWTKAAIEELNQRGK
ncbi:CvfD/Ygs/GSP13 family RNA-binding post-transcriptional regulator [Latilactobacillus sakei]